MTGDVPTLMTDHPVGPSRELLTEVARFAASEKIKCAVRAGAQALIPRDRCGRVPHHAAIVHQLDVQSYDPVAIDS